MESTHPSHGAAQTPDAARTPPAEGTSRVEGTQRVEGAQPAEQAQRLEAAPIVAADRVRQALRARFGEDIPVPDDLPGLDELARIASHATHRRWSDRPVDPAWVRVLAWRMVCRPPRRLRRLGLMLGQVVADGAPQPGSTVGVRPVGHATVADRETCPLDGWPADLGPSHGWCVGVPAGADGADG